MPKPFQEVAFVPWEAQSSHVPWRSSGPLWLRRSWGGSRTPQPGQTNTGSQKTWEAFHKTNHYQPVVSRGRGCAGTRGTKGTLPNPTARVATICFAKQGTHRDDQHMSTYGSLALEVRNWIRQERDIRPFSPHVGTKGGKWHDTSGKNTPQRQGQKTRSSHMGVAKPACSRFALALTKRRPSTFRRPNITMITTLMSTWG